MGKIIDVQPPLTGIDMNTETGIGMIAETGIDMNAETGIEMPIIIGGYIEIMTVIVVFMRHLR